MALNYFAAVNRKSSTRNLLLILNQTTDGKIGRLYLLDFDEVYVLRAPNLVYDRS